MGGAGGSGDGILVVTDGSCFGNPGPGGWAYLIFYPGGEVVKRWGSEPSTTNNRMELTAAVEALDGIGEATAPIRIVTDSQWLAFCASGKWKRRANLDLWRRFESAARGRRLDWQWQRRNVTEPMREADRLAKMGAEEASQATPG